MVTMPHVLGKACLKEATGAFTFLISLFFVFHLVLLNSIQNFKEPFAVKCVKERQRICTKNDLEGAIPIFIFFKLNSWFRL